MNISVGTILGFAAGVLLMGTISMVKPLWFVGVQKELVKQGHGHYNEMNKNFVLDECKK